MARIALLLWWSLVLSVGAARADVTLVKDGTAQCVVVVAPAVMADDAKPDPKATFPQIKAEKERQRLRDSVTDLVTYIQKMSGATVVIRDSAPPEKDIVPIYIGSRASYVFGDPKEKDLAGQGWRLVVSKKGIGCLGETDLAVSYAIYEILHRLGCRWYMPSDLGEVVPQRRTLTLAECDDSRVPATFFRGIWYSDDNFRRRNRQGGLLLQAGHALQGYITKELLAKNPDWKAIINGKPHETIFKWTHPGVRAAVAEAVLAYLDKNPVPSVSLSPDDGAEWDESDDTKFDAGDVDPTFGKTSKTDRLLVLCNEVAERVTKKHPKVLLGFLAYADYTRPPVREKLHPNLVPQIAPITYHRHHPMTWPDHPNGSALKDLVEGWARKARYVSHYWYAYNLAEVSAPNPLITRWSVDVPLVLANNCKFWQPETICNFETTFLALNLGLRLSFDASQKPADILDEIFKNFYGSAAEPMEKYWRHIDRAWTETREYAGCGFGYLRMFTPAVLKEARGLLEQAQAACKTDLEKRRVQMAVDSFRQFELFMQLRRDLVEGRLADLKKRADRWREEAVKLREQYKLQFAFNSHHGHFSLSYFNEFFGRAYDAGTKLHETYDLHDTPLRQWLYRPDPKSIGEKPDVAAWRVDFDDARWKSTDVGVETWSTIGQHNYFGKLWYRRKVAVKDIPEGKKVLLWLPSTDGSVKLWVNGKHVPYRDIKGKESDFFDGYCLPAAFDVTGVIRAGADNQITLLTHRHFFNEIGTGGLLAPPMLLVER